MDIVKYPGLAVSEQDLDHAFYYQQGYRWISYQVQNDASTRDFDLARARSFGFTTGVWGVTYSPANFYRDGVLLGTKAKNLGAQHVQTDVEYAAKNTRPGGMKPLINGIRDGGWKGPIHLNTLGAPSNEYDHDFAVDVKSFLDTGGGVIAQAYINVSQDYRPSSCVTYWTRPDVGVPRDKLNLMIAMYNGQSDNPEGGRRVFGEEWAQLLLTAGQGRQFSVWEPRQGIDDDYRALRALTNIPGPIVEEPMGALELRDFLVNKVKLWESSQNVSTALARLTIVRRILFAKDGAWFSIREDIKRLLDQEGVPK